MLQALWYGWTQLVNAGKYFIGIYGMPAHNLPFFFCQRAWMYENLRQGFEAIKNYLAFYPSKVDACYVDGKRSSPRKMISTVAGSLRMLKGLSKVGRGPGAGKMKVQVGYIIDTLGEVLNV